jgi:glycosyltransferase involved in cell wall biosynthesis
VGNINRYKGFNYLIDCIPNVLERRRDLHFVFVGPGEPTVQIPDSVRDNITIVGKVKPKSINKYFAAADLLVHPSLNEAFGRVIVEAQLAGTRTLARNVGDVRVATENTFETRQGLIDKICSFEELPKEDGKRFDRSKLKSKYVDFFSQIV